MSLALLLATAAGVRRSLLAPWRPITGLARPAAWGPGDRAGYAEQPIVAGEPNSKVRFLFKANYTRFLIQAVARGQYSDGYSCRTPGIVMNFVSF